MSQCELCHTEANPESPGWQKICTIVRHVGNQYKVGGNTIDGHSFGGYWSVEAWDKFMTSINELIPSCQCGEGVKQFFTAQTDYMIENGFLKAEDKKIDNQENKASE